MSRYLATLQDDPTFHDVLTILSELYEEAIGMNNDLLQIGKGRPSTPFSPIGEASRIVAAYQIMQAQERARARGTP